MPMEVAMIELTEQQVDALESTEGTPLRLVNPRTEATYVLLPADEYERLKEQEYDDSPWTEEELQALAWEAGRHAGWEDMGEYDEPSRVLCEHRDRRGKGIGARRAPYPPFSHSFRERRLDCPEGRRSLSH
jgi:PHD/YefM family antitoxin component YafN of YafNO toxin-antitoxin module